MGQTNLLPLPLTQT
jgi:hypothetical protein